LRRGSTIRRTRDLRGRGPDVQRKRAWRETNTDRCRRSTSICTACKQRGYIEPAHLFGKRNQVSEPLASHPAFLVPLCHECHASIDRYIDIELRERLQWEGIRKLRDAVGVTLPCRVGAEDWLPVDVAHWLDRELDDEEIYASVA